MYGRSELMCSGGTWRYETPTCIGSEKQDLYINFKYFCHIFFFTICNRSCGYVFTGVFHSVYGGAGMAGEQAWQGACMEWGVHGRGACVAGGHTWQGPCMAGWRLGRGHVWQGRCVWQGDMHCRGKERLSLQQTVCILLECILVYINFCSK